MEEVIIITMDVNGRRTNHHMLWDKVFSYIYDNRHIQDEEILLILVDGTCIYSAMWSVDLMDWESVIGFFA